MKTIMVITKVRVCVWFEKIQYGYYHINDIHIALGVWMHFN